MRSKKFFIMLITNCAIVCFLSYLPAIEAANLEENYLYKLSNFNGVVPYDWARVFADREKNEVYVLYENSVRVFNENGMEIFSFGEDSEINSIFDVSVDGEGNIFLLSSMDSQSEIIRCNFRGEPVKKINLKNLPEDFSSFLPNRMAYLNGSFYLASQSKSKIIITDSDGNFKGGFDIISILGLNEKDRDDTQIEGFYVDRDGNMLFTIPVLFTACRLSSDGKIVSFGKAGSTPGGFSVVSGITTDMKGNYLVTDKLKCVVMVFDKNFNFISEFGYRGSNPENLTAPNDIAIDSRDRVYVTQGKRRGISVYSLSYN